MIVAYYHSSPSTQRLLKTYILYVRWQTYLCAGHDSSWGGHCSCRDICQDFSIHTGSNHPVPFFKNLFFSTIDLYYPSLLSTAHPPLEDRYWTREINQDYKYIQPSSIERGGFFKLPHSGHGCVKDQWWGCDWDWLDRARPTWSTQHHRLIDTRTMIPHKHITTQIKSHHQ